MKNKLLRLIPVLLLLLCFQSGVSQVTIRPGVRSGVSLSRIGDIEGDSRTSFYAGGFVAFKLAKWYTLQPELNYSQQGIRKKNILTVIYPTLPDVNDGIFVAQDYPATWKLNYLGLTINNKFQPIGGFNIQLGPYLDFLVSQRNVDVTNDFDIGLNFGLGYDFKNGLGVEARLRAGMVDVFEDFANEEYNDGDYNYWNSAFQIGVTYTFNPNKK